MLILVVDSNPASLSALENQIQKLGHNCCSLPSAKKALDWLETSFPDVVILDILLPNSDHRELSKSIQHLAPHAKLVVLARNEAASNIKEAIHWGADDFLERPISDLRLECALKGLRFHHRVEVKERCIKNAFFNDNRQAYLSSKANFLKAAKAGIPVLIEGGSGTGKKTAAKHFFEHLMPKNQLIEIDARTQSAKTLKKLLLLHLNTARVQKVGVLVKYLEAADVELQTEILKSLENQNCIWAATTRGRLMHHRNNRLLNQELYYKMSASPIWLAPMSERPKDVNAIGRQMAAEANEIFQSNMNFSSVLSDFKLTSSSRLVCLWQLKKLIFSTAANQNTIPDNSWSLNSPKSVNIIVNQASLLENSVNLLDERGHLRPISAIETDVIAHAHNHLSGRLGQIAKCLQLSRTTLYRKLVKSRFLEADDTQKLSEQSDSFVQKPHNKTTYEFEKRELRSA